MYAWPARLSKQRRKEAQITTHIGSHYSTVPFIESSCLLLYYCLKSHISSINRFSQSELLNWAFNLQPVLTYFQVSICPSSFIPFFHKWSLLIFLKTWPLILEISVHKIKENLPQFTAFFILTKIQLLLATIKTAPMCLSLHAIKTWAQVMCCLANKIIIDLVHLE